MKKYVVSVSKFSHNLLIISVYKKDPTIQLNLGVYFCIIPPLFLRLPSFLNHGKDLGYAEFLEMHLKKDIRRDLVLSPRKMYVLWKHEFNFRKDKFCISSD